MPKLLRQIKQGTQNNLINKYDELFTQYIDVCNKSIAANKDKFPYKQIWEAGFKYFMESNNLYCAIYDNGLKGAYNLFIAPDSKLEFTKDENSVQDPWVFRYSYLKHIVDNPEEYIQHPAKLDWGWLIYQKEETN